MNIMELHQCANVLLVLCRNYKKATFEYNTLSVTKCETVPLYWNNFKLTEDTDAPFSILKATKDRNCLPGYSKVKFSKDSLLKLITKWLDETVRDNSADIDNNKFLTTVDRIKEGIEHHHRIHNSQSKTQETLKHFDTILQEWNEKSYKELKKCLKAARYNPLLEASKEDNDVQDGLFCVMALILPTETMKQTIVRNTKVVQETVGFNIG